MSKFHASVCDLLEDIYSFLSCTLKNEILSSTSLTHKEKIISGLIRFQKEYPEVHLQFKSTYQDSDGRPDSVRYSPSSPVPYVDMNGGSPYKIPSFTAQNVEGENYDLCIIKDKSANAENQSVGDSEDYMSDEAKCLPDVAASDLYACEKSGYLDKKKRDSIKGWLNPFQKRWCAIQDGVMYYYEKSSDRKQRGSIVLLGYEARALSEDAKDGKKYNHCFELVCPGKRTYQFSASSETDLKQWVAAVEKNSKVTPSINVPQKRKRVVLTMKDKVNIINRLKKGETGAKLADEYKVGTSTISNIKQNSESILEYASILYNENDDSPRKMMRGAKNEQVDRAVYAWFLEARSQGQPISGPIICEKALMLNEKMGGDATFKASHGWLRNFKARYGIREFEIHNEKLSANLESTKDFYKYERLLKNNAQQIFPLLGLQAANCKNPSTSSESATEFYEERLRNNAEQFFPLLGLQEAACKKLSEDLESAKEFYKHEEGSKSNVEQMFSHSNLQRTGCKLADKQS